MSERRPLQTLLLACGICAASASLAAAVVLAKPHKAFGPAHARATACVEPSAGIAGMLDRTAELYGASVGFAAVAGNVEPRAGSFCRASTR